MPALLKDRVLETTSVSGLSNINLLGTMDGYRTFSSSFSSGDLVYYCITMGPEWEVGSGIITSGSPWTISRDTILSSSNANTKVNFSVGLKQVFCDMPASSITEYSITNALVFG